MRMRNYVHTSPPRPAASANSESEFSAIIYRGRMMFRLLISTLYWVWLVYSEGSKESIGLAQLYDCTCAGYTQTYECTTFGGGVTIWQGSAFECSGDRIELRHSTFSRSQGATGECNEGAITARSVGVVNDSCYVSILNVTVGEEMDNRTIECARHDLSSQTNTTYGVNLDITQAPYAPPDDIRYVKMEPDRLQFNWSEVAPHCPYVQYIITARNCGICPNRTVDTTVTCTNYSSSENSTCLFAVQTETCGSILGEMSRFLEIIIERISSDPLTSTGFVERDNVNNSKVITTAALFLPITATLGVLLTSVTISVVICTIVNIKLLRDKARLKVILRMRQGRTEVAEESTDKHTNELYEEVKVGSHDQVSKTDVIDVNQNVAYSAIRSSKL